MECVLIKPTKIVPIKLGNIDRLSDIGVEGEDNQIAMMFANRRGRKAIDALWSGLHSMTGDIFRTMHDGNWLFTHVQVTDIPELFSKSKPLSEVQPDSLSFPIAHALSARARKTTRFPYAGEWGEQQKIYVYQKARREPWHKEHWIDPGRVITPGDAGSGPMSKYGPRGLRPSGRILAHNHVRRAVNMPHGRNGFRCWYDWPPGSKKKSWHFRFGNRELPDYVICKCGWRPDLGVHYRIRGMGNANYRCDT
jgi:hypothetical protein